MALTSVFYDGVVTETDRAKNRGGVPDYGVYGVADFEVAVHPSIPYAVLVKAGRAQGFGVTDTAASDQIVQCDTITAGVRWDLIVVRRNWQPSLGGPSTLVAIQVGVNPEIPPSRKVGPGVEDDQPLALVKWQGGLSAPAQIIDLRVWAGDGGMFAKDDLVRTYLTQIGAEVNINGALWRLSIGANNTPGWVKTGEIGRVRLFGAGGQIFGGSPPSGGDFQIQAGSYVGRTDGAGFERLTFPSPFPNGLLSVAVFNGDGWASGPGVTMAAAGNVTVNGTPNIFGQSGFGTKADVVYEVRNADGTMALNRPHRINWTAIGW